jgi:hypothetical protein
MNAIVQWILTSYPKIPDLPEIESIVRIQIVGRTHGRGGDFEATAGEILQVQSMVQELFKPNIGDEVPLWQMLSRRFGSLSSRFADMGWIVGALRMSYHDVHIRCALANLQSQPISLDLSESSIIPEAPPHHVEFLDAIARLLYHRSVYLEKKTCFNDARKASKEAIRIQRELRMHDPANVEFASAFSWMQKHLDSFRRQDAAYNVALMVVNGEILETFPTDVTDFDLACGFLQLGIYIGSVVIAFLFLIARRPMVAVATFATGWAMGEWISFINRRS